MSEHRNPSGRFTFNMGADELAYYRGALARSDLERILTAEFTADGSLTGVTPEEQSWMLRVLATRPAWASPVLDKLGIKPRED